MDAGNLENLVDIGGIIFGGVTIIGGIAGVVVGLLEHNERIRLLTRLKQEYREGRLDVKPNYFNVRSLLARDTYKSR